jgi:membrane-bound lytic murein transglycosylase A
MTFESPVLRRLLAPLFVLLLLSACVPAVRAPEQPVPPQGQPQQPGTTPPLTEPVPANAALAGVRPGPAISSLSIAPANAAASLRAFRISCPSLLRRTDASGLAQGADWSSVCSAAASWPENDASRFFTTHFETAVVGEGIAFATGYFEPEIAGSRTRRPGYDTPIYRTPPDLLTANPVTGERGRGRINERGEYVLYYERAEIEDGALAGRGLEIAWAADPIDLFFLEIQGSGRLKLPDGSVMRIGYANQNGREYIPVGRIMREQGILQPGGTSMQHIVAWLRANPAEARAIMRTNKSYIFFQELTGPGPLGALGLPVTGRATVAADPMFVPLGAPVILSEMDTPIANGLWVAQDTGGAIKGSNRFDTFWGAGEEAARVAGGMAARGTAYILLPKGTVARLNANGSSAQR